MSLEKSIASAAVSAAFQPAPILGRQQVEGGAVPVKPAPTYAPSRDYSKDAVTLSSPVGPSQAYKKHGEIMRVGYSSAPSLYALETHLQVRDSYVAAPASYRAPEGYSAALFGLPPAVYGAPDSRYS